MNEQETFIREDYDMEDNVLKCHLGFLKLEILEVQAGHREGDITDILLKAYRLGQENPHAGGQYVTRKAYRRGEGYTIYMVYDEFVGDGEYLADCDEHPNMRCCAPSKHEAFVMLCKQIRMVEGREAR